ncbi:MAG: bifunctional UDP-N-acetylmuramoyl-tripeptide:D-alanyl-D-alanine ligase/alanine racemase, partial [Ferruginibacter sp.]
MYKFSTIAEGLKVKPIQDGNDPEIYILLTDSRKLLTPINTLFFTVHSKIKSANDFVLELYNKGVRCFVVDNTFTSFISIPDANIIIVKNVIAALQEVAEFHRSHFNYNVVGITGSNGKTIVKEWLSYMLSSAYNIVRSPRSYNSQIGVPISVWQMKDAHGLGIFEAGISEPGEMERLEKVIKPTIGILTSIGDAHASGFKSIDQKIEEKLKLFANSQVIIYCSDVEIINKSIDVFLKEKNPTISLFNWGKTRSPQLLINSIQRIIGSSIINCRFEGFDFEFRIPFTDDAAIENAISCCCLLLYLKVPFAIIKEKLSGIPSMEMRLELIEGSNNCSLINDSYSIDLHSIHVALEFLGQQQQHKQKTVIISDIPQHYADDSIYETVAAMLIKKNITKLIGVGEELIANKDCFSAIADVRFFKSTADLLSNFNKLNFRDETILLKGARIFGFERISYLLEEKTHESVLEISLQAIRHNLNFYKNLTGDVKIMAMVKAFSYGTGSFEIANILQHANIAYLAVAYADEGIDLRKAGINLPIMVMNTEEAGFNNLIKYKLEPELYSFKILESFIKFLKINDLRMYPVHLKFDTGMHRLGFEIHDLEKLIQILNENDEIKIASAFSHLVASEDSSKDNLTNKQASLFKQICNSLELGIGYSFIKHISNSSAIVRHPSILMEMVRLGIGLYGVDSNPAVQKKLLNVATLKTTISQIRLVKMGDSVGYGGNNILSKDKTIATVRIGYADGYHRTFGNGIGSMLV